MSYQAIARKWRPNTFEEISGQGHVTKTLQNALRLNRIHHAFLFTGARGVGKTTAARTFTRCLNCVEGPTPTPCGVCASCIEVVRGGSADVVEIDGASNNSVEDVRGLRDAVRYMPARDRYRIYIIDEVHMLSTGAFNALLKTLEEPPAHVIFLFATTEPQKIPDTILSRVQRFDFKRIPVPVVVARLRKICDADGVNIDDEGLKLIARAGEGSMRDSQSLLDQCIAFGRQGEDDTITAKTVAEILGLVDRTLLFSFLEGLVRNEPDKCLDAVAQVYDYGYEMSQLTTELLELLRNAALMVLSPTSRKHIDAPADELKRLEAVTKGVTAETFSRWFNVILQVHDEVSRSNRPRLVLEMAIARLAAIRPLTPVDGLIQRLAEMEARLTKGGAPPPRKSLGAAAAPRFEEPAVVPEPPAPPAPPEPPRVEPPRPRLVEPPRNERPPEPTRNERPPEPTRNEPPRSEPRPRAIGTFDDLLAQLPRDAQYRPVIENAAFLGLRDGVLHLASPGHSHLEKGRRLEKNREVLRAVSEVFGVRALRFELRQESEGARTKRELRDIARAEHAEALKQDILASAGYREARDILGAQLVEVIPPPEDDE
ncbi:MAG: DNA polymerase III subunit gamma/tau [Proteobacteria bacterium]|nr:DNA polymerase III subunit gamma/tau [Pseudomonadota bacterium]MCP4915644.1 DNA polymerase III subunit gamma/tau [Pseudomonadota bacterium]